MGKKIFIVILICFVVMILGGCTNSTTTSENNLIAEKNQSAMETDIKAKIEVIDINKETANPSKDVSSIGEILIYTEIKPGNDSDIMDYLIVAHDEGGNRLWERVWENIQLTELEIASDYTISSDTVYIEVSGNLYALDLQTGKQKWGNVMVGSTPAPVVDEDGIIYCAGYYGPFITALYPDGRIKWQVDDLDQYYWPYEVLVKGDKVYVTFDSETDNNADIGVFEKQSGDFIGAITASLEKIEWESITASSILDLNKPNYIPENIADQNISTAWVEGKEDDGIGEWIKLENSSVQEVHKIDIYSGYQKSYDLFYANNRPKAVKIEFSDGTSLIKTFRDDLEKTSIVLGKSIKTTSIQFTILDIYKGNEYSDTCISEIETY